MSESFKIFKKFAEIFASQGTPLVSTTPVGNFATGVSYTSGKFATGINDNGSARETGNPAGGL